MWAYIKLQARSSLRNSNLLILFLLPTMIIGVLGIIIVSKQDPNNDFFLKEVTTSTIMISTLMIIINNFGANIVMIRESGWSKRIGTTQIKFLEFIGGLLIWGSLLNFAGVLWTLFLATFFSDFTHVFSNSFGWNQVDFAGLLISIILLHLLSFLFAFTFASLVSTRESYLAIANIFFISNMFLGGVAFRGIDLGAFGYVAYAFPHAYVGSLLSASLNNGNYFIIDATGAISQTTSMWDLGAWNPQEHITPLLNFLVPINVILGLSIISYYKFTW